MFVRGHHIVIINSTTKPTLLYLLNVIKFCYLCTHERIQYDLRRVQWHYEYAKCKTVTVNRCRRNNGKEELLYSFLNLWKEYHSIKYTLIQFGHVGYWSHQNIIKWAGKKYNMFIEIEVSLKSEKYIDISYFIKCKFYKFSINI